MSHLVGDFLLQTDWQAGHKTGGLGANGESRRALLRHLATYTLAFVPAIVWLASDTGTGDAVGALALVVLPHLLQDDGRLIGRYIVAVKGPNAAEVPMVALAVDQTLHFLALFGLALLVTA